ncbi:hypothetical protein BKA80DRAFT_38154 [Phyllosticta citrichinensis]
MLTDPVSQATTCGRCKPDDDNTMRTEGHRQRSTARAQRDQNGLTHKTNGTCNRCPSSLNHTTNHRQHNRKVITSATRACPKASPPTSQEHGTLYHKSPTTGSREAFAAHIARALHRVPAGGFLTEAAKRPPPLCLLRPRQHALRPRQRVAAGAAETGGEYLLQVEYVGGRRAGQRLEKIEFGAHGRELGG